LNSTARIDSFERAARLAVSADPQRNFNSWNARAMGQESVSGSVQTELWDEITWKFLLASIEERKVIPIIGPDLLGVDDGDKKTLLDRYLARRLAIEFNEPLDPTAAEPTLNEIVRALVEHEKPRGTITRRSSRC
jgi:hypothetical protein